MNSLEMKTNNRVLEIGGRTLRLDFDHQALCYAEQTYATQYGRDVNVAEIIRELYGMKSSALSAFVYGALRSAGEKVSWEEFSKKVFTYAHFDAVMDVALEAIQALFAPGEGDPAEGDTEKN